MSDVALTVLGCSGTHCGRGQVCSSYLVEHDGYRLVLDLGNGSLANLQQRIDVAELDAVLLSHLHPDHFADIYGLYYALRFHPSGEQSVELRAPAGAREFILQLLPPDSAETFDRVFRFKPVAAGQGEELGPFAARLFAANHPVEALATRLEVAGRTLAYSGDSGATPQLVECARDADVFLADSTWLESDGPHPEGVHMTGAQAGAHAAEAGAGQLVVTHVYPTVDPVAVAAEAATTYDGPIHIARDLQEHTL
jgi:ribonuclease BN (tRNA processing enzyme)